MRTSEFYELFLKVEIFGVSGDCLAESLGNLGFQLTCGGAGKRNDKKAREVLTVLDYRLDYSLSQSIGFTGACRGTDKQCSVADVNGVLL
jgi:hypothetical protein